MAGRRGGVSGRRRGKLVWQIGRQGGFGWRRKCGGTRLGGGEAVEA